LNVSVFYLLFSMKFIILSENFQIMSVVCRLTRKFSHIDLLHEISGLILFVTLLFYNCGGGKKSQGIKVKKSFRGQGVGSVKGSFRNIRYNEEEGASNIHYCSFSFKQKIKNLKTS